MTRQDHSVAPQAPDEDPSHARRKRLEKLVRETVRRAVEKGVEAGVETISRTDEAIRGVVGDVRLPREVVSYVFSTIDETKNSLVRGVAKEVRDFLDATDLSREIQRALTSLSFEIKTEIRFIPNEAGTGVKPSVKSATTTPRRRHKNQKESVRPPDEDDQSR